MSRREKAVTHLLAALSVLSCLIFFILVINVSFCRADIKPDKDTIVKDVTELTDLYETIIPVGAKAPDFVLKDIDGKVWDSKDFFGKDVTMIYFWSVFCPYCKKGLPEINVIAGRSKPRGLQTLAVNLDGIDFANAIGRFITDKQIKMIVPLDELHKNGFFVAADPYGVNQTPTVFLVDEDGSIIYAAQYNVEYDVLEELIKQNTGGVKKKIIIVVISLSIILVLSIITYLIFIKPQIIQQKEMEELKRRTDDERKKDEDLS